jgi:hypothetical protein
MFQFDLSRLDDDDVRDSIRACTLIRDHVPGQKDNPLIEYLRRLLEARPGLTTIILPIGDATGAHVLCLARLGYDVIGMAEDRQALGQFFSAVVHELESSVAHVASAAMN